MSKRSQPGLEFFPDQRETSIGGLAYRLEERGIVASLEQASVGVLTSLSVLRQSNVFAMGR